MPDDVVKTPKLPSVSRGSLFRAAKRVRAAKAKMGLLHLMSVLGASGRRPFDVRTGLKLPPGTKLPLRVREAPRPGAHKPVPGEARFPVRPKPTAPPGHLPLPWVVRPPVTA